MDGVYWVCCRELEAVAAILKQHDALRQEIRQLNNQFKKQEHEAKHGAGTFFEGDVDNLYAVEREQTVTRALPDLGPGPHQKRPPY
jgi:hypothetical protein